MFAIPLLDSAMRRACAEARRWLGATSPNPPVGAVALDAAGGALAIAAHRRAGEAHAEALLIEQCRQSRILDKIDTLCVTLEPCNHHGHTAPCTDAIIAAGIKKVAIGARDPNPHVRGGGVEKLRAAGVEVITGIAEQECQQLIHAFAWQMKNNQPWITVKRAVTRDGSMIPPAGQKTFTSPEQLRFAHLLRKKSDALLTGSGTILADNPLFTVRHVSDYPGKRRPLAILDRRGRVPRSYLEAAKQRGLDAVIYGDVETALAELAAKGARDILVEAGPALSAYILHQDLWTMSVTLREGAEAMPRPDFNAILPPAFDVDAFKWGYFLPSN